MGIVSQYLALVSLVSGVRKNPRPLGGNDKSGVLDHISSLIQSRQGRTEGLLESVESMKGMGTHSDLSSMIDGLLAKINNVEDGMYGQIKNYHQKVKKSIEARCKTAQGSYADFGKAKENVESEIVSVSQCYHREKIANTKYWEKHSLQRAAYMARMEVSGIDVEIAAIPMTECEQTWDGTECDEQFSKWEDKVQDDIDAANDEIDKGISEYKEAQTEYEKAEAETAGAKTAYGSQHGLCTDARTKYNDAQASYNSDIADLCCDYHHVNDTKGFTTEVGTPWSEADRLQEYTISSQVVCMLTELKKDTQNKVADYGNCNESPSMADMRTALELDELSWTCNVDVNDESQELNENLSCPGEADLFVTHIKPHDDDRAFYKPVAMDPVPSEEEYVVDRDNLKLESGSRKASCAKSGDFVVE